jgi:hypothetical protein
MRAILAVTDTKAVCLCVQPLKDGNYRIVAQAEQGFSPIRRNKPLSGFGIRAAVQHAVAAAQKQAGKRFAGVHVGVPGAFCQTAVTGEGKGEGADGGSPNDHLYGDKHYELIDQYPLHGGQNAMILARRDFTAEINAALDATRHRASGFYPQTRTLAAYLIPPIARESVAILLDIGYYHSDICIHNGDGQVFSVGLYLGGGHVTGDLAQIFDLEPALAEQLKRQFAFGIRMEKGTMDYVRMPDGRLKGFLHETVEEVIVARTEEICALIGDSLLHSGIDFTNRTRVYLAGEGVRGVPGTREFFASRLGYAIEAQPIALSDGTTRVEPHARALAEFVMHNLPDNAKKRPRLFGRF